MEIGQLLYFLESYRGLDKNEETHRVQTIEFLKKNKDPATRKNLSGHLTTSAWLLSPDLHKVLLTHHKKLHKWIQLGGHIEGESNLLDSALREAKEESGIENILALQPQPIDLAIHDIPAYQNEPAHKHYDLTFLLQAQNLNYRVSEESYKLGWFDPGELLKTTKETNLLRLHRKWFGHLSKK